MNLNQFHRILLQTLLLPVLSLALVAGILLLQVLNAKKTVAAIQVSDDIIASAAGAQKLMIDEETGLRGYELTADSRFLQPYNDASTPLVRVLQSVRNDLLGQHESPAILDAITAGEQTWRVSYAQPLIAQIAAGGHTGDVDLNLSGKAQMDALRLRVRTLLQHENGMRIAEVARWHKEVSHTVEALLLLALLAGIFISITTVRSLHRVSDAYQGTLDGLKQQGQAMHASEQRLRTTLTSIADGVIVTDPQGTIELLNTVAEELTGWTAEEAAGKPLATILSLLDESTRLPVLTPVAEILRHGHPLPSDTPVLLMRRDGTEVVIDESGAPIHDKQGRVTGVVMVIRDISAQRQAQSALVATEKLATAGRLAATIAHEMHNPLDSVVNLLYLLREERDGKTANQYLDMAQAELARMGQVTRAMLGLYRESSAPVPIDVRDVLTNVMLLLESQASKAEVTLSCRIPENLVIDGFPAELRQVFTNLIANATEAATPGGSVRVSAKPSQMPGRGASGISRPGVYITVSDTGTGIDQTALPHLFEPFFTTKGEKGTGLGLWVSRGIIDKHGGSIDIQSRTVSQSPENHGTAITVFLPRRASTSASVNRASAVSVLGSVG